MTRGFLTICYFYRYINLSLCLCFAESYREKIQKFLLAGTKECRNLVIRFGCAWDDKRSKKVMGSKETRDRVQKRTREYNHDTSVSRSALQQRKLYFSACSASVGLLPAFKPRTSDLFVAWYGFRNYFLCGERGISHVSTQEPDISVPLN